jgi:hypothetical protein
LAGDNPFTGAKPPGADACTPHGNQIDIVAPPVVPPVVDVTVPGGQPQYDWTSLAAICPGGLDIRSTTLIMMQILKAHFSNAANIVDPDLKQYVYTTDQATSKLRIVMNTALDLTQAGQLPALIVKRGAQKQQRAVMGDVADVDGWKEGLTKYSRIWQGAHRILVMGQVDGQTEALAQEVNQLMTCVSPVLRYDVPFLDFQVSDMSELGIVEELGQTLAVAITCEYAYEYGWTVRRNAPNLRAVTFDVSATLAV